MMKGMGTTGPAAAAAAAARACRGSWLCSLCCMKSETGLAAGYNADG